ncbi:rho GTPase-activating protein 7 isoform X1 [Carcharodon carcharias]|uniref:rho GTPase-activating protein 7 isoform X1 n=1 Tax=Carcharodon carcharias TaxID=13397 RepID=UPI001B7F5DC9|nr:rho GTPase-activating protein 7 isoform X1 [Carcharodon carcharias]XP_041041503.1 rho GTPase-activating protein 7 isoform X1 [Carcharodon carcharias]
MSLANKKRSWEDHVTNWPGFSFDSVDSGAVCCHGLVADNLKPSMESNEISKADKKERFSSISLPECCRNSNLSALQSKQLCDHRREVDENDNHESEDYILPLEASTETLVHVSDENSDLSCEENYVAGELQPSRYERVPFEVSPLEEIEQVTKNISENFGIDNDPDYDSVPEEEEKGDEKTSDSEHPESSEELDLRDLPKKDLDKSLNVIIPTEELLHTAVIAQQRRKHDMPRGECDGEVTKNMAECLVTNGDVQSTLEDTHVNCIIPPQTCSRESLAQTFLEEFNLDVGQAENDSDTRNNTTNISKQSSQILNLQENTNNVNPADSTIKLRKRKEMREDRDRARLDSMVLLIMKLDQLDQDIENALSANSSPSSTPTVKRRHIPELESDSENGADVIAISQNQKVHPVHSPLGSTSPMAGPGAKPKAGAMPVISEKGKAEIEAKEACDWLRATGFPQYAQLYEDSLFPIDISSVKRDHDFLDRDAIESLCRRLNTLNKCAVMKLEISPQRKRKRVPVESVRQKDYYEKNSNSEDSDEDEPCAISGRWTFQRDSKRWSRLEEFDVFSPAEVTNGISADEALLKNAVSNESVLTDLSERQEVTSIHSASSTESNGANLQKNVEAKRTNSEISVISSGTSITNVESFGILPSPKHLSGFTFNVKTERNTKSKAKSFLKRMESLRIKSSHSKKKLPSKNNLVISGPVLQEGIDEEKLKRLNCIEITALNGNHMNAPMVRNQTVSYSTQTSSSSSQSETSSAVSTPSPVTRTRSHSTCNKRSGMYLEGFDPFSQSMLNDIKEQNLKNEKVTEEDIIFYIPEDHKPGTFPKALSNGNSCPPDSTSINWRNGSFHGHNHRSLTRESSADSSKESSFRRRRNSCSSSGSRLSIYDNVPGSHLYSSTGDLADLGNEEDIFPELDDILHHVNGLQRIVNQWSEKLSDEGDSDSAMDSISPCPSSPKQIHLDIENGRASPSDVDSTGNSLNETEDQSVIRERRDSGVGASLTRSNRRQRLRWGSFQISHRPSLNSASLQINSQSVAQMNLLQKFSLLKLTALMEKYSPSNKHGFNWTVPKFMKRIKVPDYKDRNVFGVPLLVNVQRSGHPLPQSIQQAMRYLRNQCLDQVGLFRKSGVKSRIQALRQMNETCTDSVNYEGQSAYDVADMLKQYFRDLPEPLMTSKLSETFLQIYQYVPKDQRLQAIQAGIMLLPDENREALQTLLYFLSDVAAVVEENQMTPTNLAVCLAPSLFHLNTLKRENSSPRVIQRKQSLGKPDQKDLNENLAATQGLAHMIAECKKLFKIPEEMMSHCRNSYMEQDLQPVSLEELGQTSQGESSDFQAHLQNCIDILLKEAKDKFKGWVNCSTSELAELAYKKVCDGPPLKLWKACIEIPVAPEDVLWRILRDRHLWDDDLLSSKIIENLNSQTDIYHYVQSSMAPHPTRDYVLIRTWRTNLPKGSCALVATSVEHNETPVVGGVRANTLTSRYLIEPCGSGKSKLTYLCRIDTRGRMPEWYNKAFGHLCAAEIGRIRDSFNVPGSDSQESKH